MSDRDSFIDEVSEEVRRDRMFGLWRKYGPFVIGGVVAIVVFAGVRAYLADAAKEDARAVGGAIIAAGSDEPAAAAAALSSLADGIDESGAAVLARLRAAAAFATAGDRDAAIAAYEVVAADDEADLLLQDFAAYRSAVLKAQDADPAAAIEILNPIANGGGPFALLGLEAQGMAHWRAGEVDEAGDALRAILADETAPLTLRQRVSVLMTAIGADPGVEGELLPDGDGEG